MGYSLELGYARRVTQKASGGTDIEDFEVARVKPFRAGHNIPLPEPSIDRVSFEIHRELGELEEPQAIEDGLFDVPEDFAGDRITDNEGLVDASIDLTYNYSPRIKEITGLHLAELRGRRGIEAAPVFMELIAGLGDEANFDDPFDACDGNIKRTAAVLLDWTFQHPDGVFDTK